MSKDNVYVDYENRTIFLSDGIDNEVIGKLCASFLEIISEDDANDKSQRNYHRKPIKFYINSRGGEIYDMWALVDIIANSKTPIHTYCTGYAMSAGLTIFLAGHQRFCSKHATFLYHQMSCTRNGKYQDMVEDREEMDYLNKQNEQYIMERTNLTEKDLLEIKEKKMDKYIHADEALKLNIVNKII